MRILIDGLSILPSVTLGTEAYVQGLIAGLAQAGPEDEFLLVCTKSNRKRFPEEIPNLVFHVAPFDNSVRAMRVLYEQFVLPIVAKRWRADVVVFPANMMAATLPLYGVPAVVTIHDLAPEYYRRYLPAYMDKVSMFGRRFLLKNALKHARAILVPSEFTRKSVALWSVEHSDKVLMLHSGVPGWCERTQNDRAVLPKCARQAPYVLCVGSINKHKNLERMAQAFALFKKRTGLDHHLIIAGPAGTGYDDLQRAVAKEEIADFVHCIGHVENTVLAGLYRDANIFAMVSQYEGFGFPALEALYFGVPSVVADAGSLPEVVGNAALTVDPVDVEQIASALSRLASDTQLRRELVTRGKEQVLQFEWSTTGAKALAVCREAAHRSFSAEAYFASLRAGDEASNVEPPAGHTSHTSMRG